MIKNPCCNEIGLKNKPLTINILTTLFRDIRGKLCRGDFFSRSTCRLSRDIIYEIQMMTDSRR